MRRQPAVAGRFYPRDPDVLRHDLARYCADAPTPRGVAAVIAPHAGFVFSGPTAGKVYGGVEVPDVVIVLGPNHTGQGKPIALDPATVWDMPLGPVEIDQELAAEVLAHMPGVEHDPLAHRREHGIEAHVPFLQVRRADVRIVPLVIAGRHSVAACREMGLALAEVIAAAGGSRRVLLAASTDMSHFLGAGETERLDGLAIARMLAFDPPGLHETVLDQGISMCGVIPTTIVLFAARALGATSVNLVEYTHSGHVSGDMDRVVGYAGLVVQ